MRVRCAKIPHLNQIKCAPSFKASVIETSCPNRFIKYKALSNEKKNALAHACWQLSLARLALTARPFRNLVAGSELSPGNAVPNRLESSAQRAADTTAWAVQTAAGQLPWRSNCLVQAIAAQRMLIKQDVSGVIYLGAASGTRVSDQSELMAHAWLKCGDNFITGEFEAEGYSAIAAFRW